MSKYNSSKSTVAIAPSAKATAKAKAARRAAEVEMVQTIGSNLNQMVSTICEAVVESRKVDLEGLESSDKAEVLKHEGTTLVSLVESNNEAISAMWASVAPMVMGMMAQINDVQRVRADAAKISAEAELINAKSREKEAEIKEINANTERDKAETARMRAETELEAARERAAERAAAKKDVPVNGVEANEVW